MYRIYDPQCERYFHDGEVFKNEKEAWEALASFHDIDFTGVKDNDEPYKDIYEYLELFKTDEDKLNELLEHGQWELEKVGDFTAKIQRIDYCLNNYLQALYRCGSAEEQDEVAKALKDLEEISDMPEDLIDMCEDNEVMEESIKEYFEIEEE